MYHDEDIIDLDASVREALTDKGGWRGGGRPGRPRRGQETKKSYAQALAERETLREVHEAQVADPADLFNAADPSVAILHEKPEHRMLAYMRARGMSRKEIYEQLGGEYDAQRRPISGTGKYSYVQLGNILKQPWFRAHVIRLQHEAGFDLVESAIRAELPAAVETVVEIMNDTEARAADRLNAAAQILDRGLGKAVQRVEQRNSGSIEHVLHDARELDRELEKTRQELRMLGAGA